MRRSVVGARALALAAACALGARASAAAQAPTHLWVLRPPDALVAYDVARFSVQRTLPVPSYLAGAPEYVDINPAGEVLFRPPPNLVWAGPDMAPASGRMWLWDGTGARSARLSATVTIPGRTGRTSLEVVTLPWLSARGDSLYRFESRFQKTLDSTGIEQATRNSAGLRRTPLAGTPAARGDSVVTLPELPACPCTTGACEESCPEWSFWAPDGGVGDVFLLTRWIPGQLGTTYEETVLYRRLGGRWAPSPLPQAVEAPLDASPTGDLLVAAEPDGGCCGWANDGSDRLLLVRGGAVTVLYDEFARFANVDYDVSFALANARLAPGNRLLAYTLVADVGGDSGQVRLSSSGKPNPAELQRVRETLAQMPEVEVTEVSGGAPRRLTTIPHAGLVGWLSEHELLLAQGGRLVVYDLRGGAIRPTGIPVRSERDAFLR